jgi:anti-sigma factor RsiW
MSDRPRPSEEEINRFVDGDLPSYRRTEIEATLAADPVLAARVMADLPVMDVLRADQPRRFAPRPEALAAARRLQRRMRLRRVADLFRRGAAAAAVVVIAIGVHGSGLLGLSDGAALDDDFVEGAQTARDIVRLDGPSPEGAESHLAKLARLETAIEVDVPVLPPGWEVHDVSVQALDGTRSVVVSAKSGALGDVTLVATPAEEAAVVPPTAADDGPVATVVWQSHGTAYALVGTATASHLINAANSLGERIW